jgi:hypothetical protein
MRLLRALPVLGLVGISVVACGSSDGSSSSGFSSSGESSSGASSSGASSSGASSSGASSSGFGSSGNSSGSSSGDQNCAATVAQTQKAKVDIIFVIDDSGSMTEELNQIKVNVNTFASKIGGTGLDYQVIFIVKKGTSGNTICVPTPLAGTACADNPPLFHHINQDVQSTDSLTLILSTYNSTNPALAWDKYLRMDAYKVFVEVTDDQSSLASASFDTQLLAKPPAGMFGTAAARKYVFHSIVGWQEGTAPLSATKCSTAVNTGSKYQELSQLTGGIIDSVCKTDYSGVLNNIGKGIADKLGCELTVPSSATADPTKLVVRKTPPGAPPSNLTQVTDASKCAANPDAWYYDDNAKPTKIILCPNTCTDINKTSGTKIEALVGCAAPPPK